MTSKERQDRLIELRNKFTPITYNFVGKPFDDISYQFTYVRGEGDPGLLTCEPQCGPCTTVRIEGDKLLGVLTLNEEYKASHGQTSLQVTKHIKVWFDDGEDWYIIDDNGNRLANPDKIQVPLYLQGQVDLRE